MPDHIPSYNSSICVVESAVLAISRSTIVSDRAESCEVVCVSTLKEEKSSLLSIGSHTGRSHRTFFFTMSSAELKGPPSDRIPRRRQYTRNVPLNEPRRPIGQERAAAAEGGFVGKIALAKGGENLPWISDGILHRCVQLPTPGKTLELAEREIHGENHKIRL